MKNEEEVDFAGDWATRRPPFSPTHRLSFRSSSSLSPLESGWVGKIPVQWGDNPLLIFHTSAVLISQRLFVLRSNILARESGETGWVLTRYDPGAPEPATLGLRHGSRGRDLSDSLLDFVSAALRKEGRLPPSAFIEMDTLPTNKPNNVVSSNHGL